MPGEQTDALAPLAVFYSYAHEDEALRDKLEEHLRSLQTQGLISAWYDRQIVAGTEWAYAIDSHLQTASIILLLISPAFMASDYCISIEMQQAMERHRLGDARVIPIILEPTAWHDAPFAILQCLPCGGRPVTTWDNPEDAFEDIAQGVHHAIEEMNLLYTGGPRPPSVPMTLAPADGQWRKVSNQLPSPIDSQSRQRMLERVRAQWITGLLKDSLREAALITLGLHEQPDAVANPWSFSLQEMNQPARPLRLGTRAIQVYDYAQGELLILGEPGSGKTTLLLELTRDLIERAKRDETHPIPVVFNLSSWSLKQQPIADWLVEELVFKYQVPRKLAQRWIETEQVLPLLDGLDEVTPNHRAACIEAVNRYKQGHGLLPMVICSRSADYLAQKSRVLLRTAIVIQPLTREQIESYLASAKKQLAPVREALKAGAELQELASTPLMLSILTLAYHGSSLNDLLAVPSPLARRRQIFATYVQRMFQRRGDKANYTPQQTIQWLVWLARQMVQHGQAEFYLERMQPDWLSGRWSRLLYSCVVRSIVWLMSVVFCGIVGGVVGGVDGQLLGSALVGALIGILNGAFIGILVGSFVRIAITITPAEAVVWSWKRLQRRFEEDETNETIRIFLMFVVVVVGMLGALVGGLISGLIAASISGAITLLIFGFIIGPFGGWSSEMLDEHNLTLPNQGIRHSARNCVFAGLASGLGGGLIFGLIGVTIYFLIVGVPIWKVLGFNGLLAVLLVGMPIGSLIGWINGLLNGGVACIQHVVLRIFLQNRKSIPWNYPRFLDYSAERILLRKVGGGYLFIHRMLLEYFATLETIPAPEKSPAHGPSG